MFALISSKRYYFCKNIFTNFTFDKSTLKRLLEIQNMKPDFKSHLFSVIDSVIRDYKTQQAYTFLNQLL